MFYKKGFKRFIHILEHPKVIVFMLVGIGIIFLTFLTNDNALEIAISGIASVFIGIAVNNFSIIDTHQADQNRLKLKIAHSVKMMKITISNVKRFRAEMNHNDYAKMRDELAELEQCMNLAIELMEDAGLTE